ncbi:molybdopterin converting factor subunit 1 [soil metagenome]
MLVTLRMFARLREISGTSELQVVRPEGSNASALWSDLAQEYPGLAPYTGSVSCAINQEYAKLSTALKEGDEIAFLPPVSGG